jgi:hypothetical protein
LPHSQAAHDQLDGSEQRVNQLKRDVEEIARRHAVEMSHVGWDVGEMISLKTRSFAVIQSVKVIK